MFFVKEPFFIQTRIGRDNKPFKILKFRTLRFENDDHSITSFGKVLRTLSIDEWPQLINILKGEMSFIGPRPLLDEYLPLYNDRQSSRHKVKPGITGWAQVNGRNKLSWNESLEMDAYYAENVSFKLDMIVLFKTVLQLFKFKQVEGKDNITRGKFKGNN